MRKLIMLLLSLIILPNSITFPAHANSDQTHFDINLDGFTLYVLDNFVEEIDKGKVTPLAKTFLEVL